MCYIRISYYYYYYYNHVYIPDFLFGFILYCYWGLSYEIFQFISIFHIFFLCKFRIIMVLYLPKNVVWCKRYMPMPIQCIQCELKYGNRNSILNLSKSKRNIMKLLSVDDSIFIFLSCGTLVVHIGSGMDAQQSYL